VIGVDRSRHPARGPPPERGRSTKAPTRAIRLPPLRSPKDGPPQISTLDPRGPCPGDTAAYASQEEDTVPRSRPGAAIGSGLPPNCLANNVCHRPTIHRLRQSPQARSLRVFRYRRSDRRRTRGSFGTTAARVVDLPRGSEPPGTRGTGVKLDPQLGGPADMEQLLTPPTGRF